jgi:hypothetical protein
MENKIDYVVLAQQSLIYEQLHLLHLQINLAQLGASQTQSFQSACVGNQYHGAYGNFEGEYCYQPQFDCVPKSEFLP